MRPGKKNGAKRGINAEFRATSQHTRGIFSKSIETNVPTRRPDDPGPGAERGTTPHRQRRRFRFGAAAVRNLRSASRAASMALIWPSSP